jgi:hypothetical protein
MLCARMAVLANRAPSRQDGLGLEVPEVQPLWITAIDQAASDGRFGGADPCPTAWLPTHMGYVKAYVPITAPQISDLN